MILYLSPKFCVTVVALLLLLFLSSSLVFVACCLWYCSSGSFDFLVLLLWCELIQSGVVGSRWSFYFVPVLAWNFVLTFFIFVLRRFLVVSQLYNMCVYLCVCVYIYLYIFIYINISVSDFFLELMLTNSILQGKSPRAKYSFHIFS